MADSDDEEEEDAPVVELGEGNEVEGAPLARVASRQTWGMEKSRLVEREADTEIRTPDGPRGLDEVLEAVDTVYFTRRQEFVDAIESVVGTGPVPTIGDEHAGSNGEGTENSNAVADEPNATNTDTNTDDDRADDGSEFEFDPDSGDDAEARAVEQGEAHAETSSDADGETGNDGDTASTGESNTTDDTDDTDDHSDSDGDTDE